MIKVAFFCPPHDGGAYTSFERLRRPLAENGYDLRCIGLNDGVVAQSALMEEPADGVDSWQVSRDPACATRQIIDRLTKERYRIVMTMPLDQVVSANLPRYLPSTIGSIIMTPMISHSVYTRTRHMAKFADKIVAVSHRVATDLIRRYRIEPGKVCEIFNGVDAEKFANRGRVASPPGQLRALYLGRISDLDKGVFLLPEIMDKVRRRARGITMDVVGDGSDERALRARIHARGMKDCLRLRGRCPLSQVPALLREYDCLAMPSRIEACGWSLLEAMATGCVPVVHDIWGSMGMIVQDGTSGFLVPVGDTKCFSDRLIQLSQDPGLRKRLGEAARLRVQQAFSLDQMARDYAVVMNEVLVATEYREAALPLERYTVPSVLRRSWRSYLPKPIKAFARQWVVRMGLPA